MACTEMAVTWVAVAVTAVAVVVVVVAGPGPGGGGVGGGVGGPARGRRHTDRIVSSASVADWLHRRSYDGLDYMGTSRRSGSCPCRGGLGDGDPG